MASGSAGSRSTRRRRSWRGSRPTAGRHADLGRPPLEPERGRAARAPERRRGGPRRLRLHAHRQLCGARLDEPVGCGSPATPCGPRSPLASRSPESASIPSRTLSTFKPVQGAVTINGAQAVAHAARNGRAVDHAAVLRLVGAAVISATTSRRRCVVVVTPDISTADAQTAAATARTWLSGPLALTHGGHTWTIAGRTSASTLPSSPRRQAAPARDLRLAGHAGLLRLHHPAGRHARQRRDLHGGPGGKRVKIKRGTSGTASCHPDDRQHECGGRHERRPPHRRRRLWQSAAVARLLQAKAMQITTRIGTYTTSVAGTANRLTNVGWDPRCSTTA